MRRVQDKILRRQGRRAATPGRLGEPSLPWQTKKFVVRPVQADENSFCVLRVHELVLVLFPPTPPEAIVTGGGILRRIGYGTGRPSEWMPEFHVNDVSQTAGKLLPVSPRYLPSNRRVWRMDIISNNNQLGSAAFLKFDAKPDGTLQANFQLMGLMEGLIIPSFMQDHFQLNDFTTFHDEIRKVDTDLLVGKYVTALPPGLSSLLGGGAMGIFHNEPGSSQFGFYYALSRATMQTLPTVTLLRPRRPDAEWVEHDLRRGDGWLVHRGRVDAVAWPSGRPDHCRPHSCQRQPLGRCSVLLHGPDEHPRRQ